MATRKKKLTSCNRTYGLTQAYTHAETHGRTHTNKQLYKKQNKTKKQMNQIQTQTDVKWGRKTTGTNSATQADMSTQTSKQTVLGDSRVHQQNASLAADPPGRPTSHAICSYGSTAHHAEAVAAAATTLEHGIRTHIGPSWILISCLCL